MKQHIKETIAAYKRHGYTHITPDKFGRYFPSIRLTEKSIPLDAALAYKMLRKNYKG